MSIDRPAEAGTVRRRLAATRWEVVAPIVLYVLVSLAGISLSSIGIAELREDPADPTGVMLGDAQAIRADEFLTGTPILLGVEATGRTDDLNPLTAPQQLLAVLPAGPVTSVLYPDGTALRLGPYLPDSVLHSARAWLGTLLLLLAAPAWFRRLTGSRWIGWFAVALVVFSPANAWWSNSHAAMLGFAFAGALALARAVDASRASRWPVAAGWGLLSAALLVRTPLMYPPWAVVLVPTVVLATVAACVARPEARRRTVATIAAVGALTLTFLALVLWESSAALEAAGGTVYPGDRASSGAASAFQLLFGATSLDELADGAAVVGSNASEISSGFTIALVLAVLLLVRGMRWQVPGQHAAVVAAAVLTGFWTLWATVDLGDLGARIPGINIVPPARDAQVLGHLGVILLCLVLPAARRRASLAVAALAGGTTAVVAAHAGSLLRTQNLPEMSLADVWLAAAAVCVVVLVLVRWPRRPAGYVLGSVLALSLVWNVNPVLFGLGDLRGTEAADAMLADGEDARADGTVWASDHYSVDALMIATGVPALSGRQMSGPDRAVWERLDPGGVHEDVWNRGGAYIWFSWSGRKELVMDNPSPDVIHVTGSPCEVAERLPRLGTIVARQELDLDCLRPDGTFTWGGATRWVYAIDG
ncbi:unannotated protein [freshwater metagenome]|uniref:Unannotated protein n=1 Tax=freshwater metagenome TaxID=449393 RepID=A0A6J7KUB0_9ZZZZ|nr:hypothetical protein [Actinomycetota bacterium]